MSDAAGLVATGLVGAAAHRMAAALDDGLTTSEELVAAHLDRIDVLEHAHHALASRRARDEVLADARAADDRARHEGRRSWLDGLPFAVKDLTDVAGLPTGLGLWRVDEAPTAVADADFVPRLRASGAVFVGKTATPEFGLGSHTYTAVGPPTTNAIDVTRSAGGSSGGAAVAVATGMLPVADGSDFMGSLRNPPGWNGVFGLRPSALVPAPGRTDVRGEGGVEGPVARDATDLRLLLQTLTGRDVAPVQVGSVTVAWLGDLDGYLPTEPGVLELCERGLALAQEMLGWRSAAATLPVVDGHSPTEVLWPTWCTFRHASVGGELATFAAAHDCLDRLKPEARWEIDGWRGLTDADRAAMAHGRMVLLDSVVRLFERVHVLALPTAQVFPFDSSTRWPAEVAGRPMDTYHRWMEVTTPATLLGLPAVAVPLPSEGPPLGLQLVARHGEEGLLLALAAQWQRATAGLPGVRLVRGGG